MRTEFGRPSFSMWLRDMDSDLHLGPLALIGVRAQAVTDHLLEARHTRFRFGPLGVAGRCLPGHAAVLGDVRRTSQFDVLEVAVPLCRCGRGRVARHRVRAWRHDDHRFWMALGDAARDTVLIVGTVAGEGGERALDLVEQGAHLRAIVHVLGGQQEGDDLSSASVHADMQLSPGPAHLGAVLLMQPFARTAHLQSRAVHQQVHGFAARAGAEPWTRYLQRLRPAAKRAVVRDGQIDPPLPFHALPRAEPLAAPPEQAYDGADQALRLAQSQPEHCPERQPCQDGQR